MKVEINGERVISFFENDKYLGKLTFTSKGVYVWIAMGLGKERLYLITWNDLNDYYLQCNE